MVPYFVLLIIPFVVQFFAITPQNKHLVIGSSAYVKNNNFSVDIFFFLLMAMLALRHETVGKDLMNYKYIFAVCSKRTLKGVATVEIEPLYAYLNWFIGNITDNYQIFIAIIAIITIIPIWSLYRKDSRYGYLKIVVFVNMSTFIMLFSGIRQSLAMALGMIAFYFVQKKAIVRYGLICVLAIGVHTSAIMLLLMYPLYYANIKRKHFVIIIVGIIGVLGFNRQIFSVLGKLLYTITDYSAEISSTNAYGTLILFLVFLMFSYCISDESKMSREAIGLRNFLVICVVIQCFAPVHTLAMRMGYYYILFLPLVISNTLIYRKQKYKQIANLAEIVMVVFFVVMFVCTTYQEFMTGNSALDTVPYIVFWKG